ncbi:MAG: queuosine precursor transporter [Spirochaetales bacterium]|nr:queuosine precursor transporter [Spirochaetales bacterium]
MLNKRKLTSRDCLMGLSAVYVVIAVMMNVFAMKALSFGSSIIICDGGLLISWGVFLISNVVVEVWDKRTSLVIVTFAAVVALVFLSIGRLIVAIPSLPSYDQQAEAFAMVFSNGPRTILASAFAFWLGNFVNVHIIHVIKKFLEDRKRDNRFFFFFRASVSTLFGQFVDNIAFMSLAFGPFGISVYEMAWYDILTSALVGTVIELVVESFLVPFITMPLVKVIKAKKQAEEAAA